MTSGKTKPVAASRRWRARSSRELAGLTYEQLQTRLSKFATAETLLPAPGRRVRRKAGVTWYCPSNQVNPTLTPLLGSVPCSDLALRQPTMW
jgi:hypothetical protein